MNSRLVLNLNTKPYQNHRNPYLHIKTIGNYKKLGNQKTKIRL